MKRHWKKFVILGLVIAVAVMLSLPGAVLASPGSVTFTKKVNHDTVTVGEEVIYTFTVTAKGCELQDIKINDVKLDIVNLALPDIGAGEIATVEVPYTTTEVGTLVNTATATVTEGEDNTFTQFGTATVKVVEVTEPTDGKGDKGSRGSTGRAGKDVVRMFSTDGGNEDPWSSTSESVDKYMLESTTYAGKTTHIIVEIVFMVEQADGSLVFMAK